MELYHTAGHLIRRSHQIDAAIFADETTGYDITSPQWAALRTLAEHPGIELTRLSELIAYDRSTIGALVDRLVAKDLVTRTTGARDRRTRELVLTSAGNALVDELKPRLQRVQERLLGALTLDERAHFLTLLERIVADEASSRPVPELSEVAC